MRLLNRVTLRASQLLLGSYNSYIYEQLLLLLVWRIFLGEDHLAERPLPVLAQERLSTVGTDGSVHSVRGGVVRHQYPRPPLGHLRCDDDRRVDSKQDDYKAFRHNQLNKSCFLL